VACVFGKALLARAAQCELARRRAMAERDLIECSSPEARMDCQTLAQLTRERARFVLKLPRSGAPVLHAQAMRLQCGGLQGLQQALGLQETDVHRLLGLAQERRGSLTELPWDTIVHALVQWRPRGPRRPMAR
jgi:hypothetical protein